MIELLFKRLLISRTPMTILRQTLLPLTENTEVMVLEGASLCAAERSYSKSDRGFSIWTSSYVFAPIDALALDLATIKIYPDATASVVSHRIQSD